MKGELISLRDIAVFAFVMLNALFVLIVFLLQLNKEALHIQWPLNASNRIEYDSSTNEFTIIREYLELEPIGLMFVLFFGVILMVQFAAMLVHRFATISQILATTELDWYFGKNDKDITAQAELSGKAVTIAMRTQKPQPQWDEENMTREQEKIGRRQTIHRILYQHRNRQDWSNLEANFKRRYFKDGEWIFFHFYNNKKCYINCVTGALDINMQRMSMSRKTITLLDHRRRSILQERKDRRSQLINHPPNHHMTGVDHTYNTVQWLSESTSFNQTTESNARINRFDSANREGVLNLAFEATSYDDVYAGPPAEVGRPRQSRVTFS